MEKDIAKAYEPKERETDIYRRWEESGLFNPDAPVYAERAKTDRQSYAIVMPPPNVTGVLHMGHASMLALEDILTRFYRLRGYDALWLPGSDHAAIATQTKVEKILKKEENKSRHDLGREEFLKKVRQFAQDSHDTIVGQVKAMGCSCDWSREAYTLDETRNKAVRAVFKLMYDDGLIYRGERVVNWCPRCKSTLADDEVEYKAQKAKLYFFKYDKNFPLTIATTRPETKLGDTAVAVNPKDERYKKYIGQSFEVDFAGVKLTIKVIADRNIEMEFGTGALGVTPAHSMVDWQMAEANALPIVKVIDEDGNIRQEAKFGAYAGKSASEARELVVAQLRERGLLEKEEEMDNNLSTCYRCDTPIEPLPSLQWFINVNKKIARHDKTIKELCLEAVNKGVFGRDKIRIVPERFEKNYFNWMENLRDWCISRQIWFGHQVPVWYRGEEMFVGLEAPAGEGWRQDEDTLDTWFSSGLWTFSTLAHSPEEIRIENNRLVIDNPDFARFHPNAVLETGYDILFFWVARMIIMTTYATEDIPFQDVYLHGLVLDEKGKKMSKSKGNTLDPLDMIAKYGTDATRLSLVIGSAPGNDLRLAEEKIEGFKNLVNKIWNVSRFILMNLDGAEGDFSALTDSDLTLADQWILGKMKALIEKTTADLSDYRFSQAGEALREFTWNDLADWYLEASKFEKHGNKSLILKKILEDLLKLWHPFIPFVTETIWGEFQTGMLATATWPEADIYVQVLGGSLNEGEKFEKYIKESIVAIRNARAENKVEPSRKIKAVICAGDKKDLLEEQAELLRGLRTGLDELEIRIEKTPLDDAICVVAGELEIYLLGAIDKEKEKERLRKEIESLEKAIANAEARLSNEEFTAKAPATVIEKERASLASRKGELEVLKGRMV